MRRFCTGTPVASSSPKYTLPALGASKPAITRNSVVLPEPDGPSKAINSPSLMSRLTPRKAPVLPKSFAISTTRICNRASSHARWAGQGLAVVHFKQRLREQRDERQKRQQRRHGESRGEIVFVVEDFDLQRHGVGEPADMARDHRHGAEFSHCARVAQEHAVYQAPADIGQRDGEKNGQAACTESECGLLYVMT